MVREDQTTDEPKIFEAEAAINAAKKWINDHNEKYSLDDVVQVLHGQPGALRVIDKRLGSMIIVFKDDSGIGVSIEGLDLLRPTDFVQKSEWNPDDWDGMSEEEAFEEDAVGVLSKLGRSVASQSWSCGSWSGVYEYRGKYFAIDEQGIYEESNPRDAFASAGIGRDTYDKIADMYVAPGFEQWIFQKTDESASAS